MKVYLSNRNLRGSIKNEKEKKLFVCFPGLENIGRGISCHRNSPTGHGSLSVEIHAFISLLKKVPQGLLNIGTAGGRNARL